MNSSSQDVVDQQARQAAIDPRYSYAVQAPAGSGKTELLSLRFLKLLALCQKPEEILAITFTRKAAAEMAKRIIDTLRWADSTALANTQDLTPLELQKHAAASAVLERDRELSWRLLQTPARMRIQTIDSFCNQLSARLPLLSGLGATANVSADVNDCMSEAVRDTLAMLDSKQSLSQAIEKLLRHFDNNTSQVEALLVNLLYKRNQWAPIFTAPQTSDSSSGQSTASLKRLLESNIAELITENLQKISASLTSFEYRIMPLLAFAASQLREIKPDDDLALFHDSTKLPDAHPQSLHLWKSIAALFTTFNSNKINWRKSFTKNNGFPAPSSTSDGQLKTLYKSNKTEVAELIAELSENAQLLEAFETIRYLPGSAFTQDDEDALLDVLTEIAPTLLAYLQLAFSRHRKVDYEQLSQAALQSLGSDQSPTDIALALDNQLQHILVDEFQDTSSLQFSLLEKLTAGWSDNDGRTLFIVGDAMQSCYGFRNANVGLFIRAREHGIGSVKLKPLDLLTNFRSHHGVVNWLNTIFSEAFPSNNDISLGAVSYSASQAHHQIGPDDAVSSKFILSDAETSAQAREQEANEVVERIVSLRQQMPADSIAILVRNRSHLKTILPALRASSVSWSASEIDPLVAFPAIQDLLVLLKTLINKADHLSWYALLRAPWCGLTLDQLLILNKTLADQKKSIACLIQGIQSESIQWLSNTALSDNSQQRIEHLARVMHFAQHSCALTSVVELLRISWEQLGGNDIYASDAEQLAIARFFVLLQQQQVNGTINDVRKFEEQVTSTFVSSNSLSSSSDNDAVTIMTIHKAKGLEFDHVIIAGLDRKPRADDSALLTWHQRLNLKGQPKLLLATKAATGQTPSALYQFIRHEQTQKTLFENTRLLYIAISRARKTVLLTAVLRNETSSDDSGFTIKPPTSASLLFRIWNALQSRQKISDRDYVTVLPNQQTADSTDKPLSLDTLEGTKVSRITMAAIEKLQQQYEPPRQDLLRGINQAEQSKILASTNTPQETTTLYSNADFPSSIAKENGILLHRALQFLADKGITKPESISDGALTELNPIWHSHLFQIGATIEQVEKASEFIKNSIIKVFQSAQCNWVFSGEHLEAKNEYALNSMDAGRVYTHIIDRTFVDSKNIRWIVDYKSTQFAGDDEQLRLQIAQYKPQLDRYRKLFEKLEQREIITALLFTETAQLVEVN